MLATYPFGLECFNANLWSALFFILCSKKQRIECFNTNRALARLVRQMFNGSAKRLNGIIFLTGFGSD